MKNLRAIIKRILNYFEDREVFHSSFYERIMDDELIKQEKLNNYKQ